MTRLAIFLTIALALLTTAPPSRGEHFSDNGTWGVVSASSYQVTLHKNGSFVLDVKDTMKFNCSFIRCWVAYQQFPQIQLLSAEMTTAQDASSIRAVFTYFWDEGSVVETLVFTIRGIEASYTFTPWHNKDIQFMTCLVRPEGKPKDGMGFVATDRANNSGRIERFDGQSKIKGGYSAMSLRDAGLRVVDFAAESGGWFSIETFPALMLKNNGTYPMWDKTNYKKGEEFRLSYSVFISDANGRNPSPGKVEFSKL